MALELDRTKIVYQERYRESPDTPRGLFWNNRETQELRFSRLLRYFPELSGGNFHIHDVGCGVCDLHGLLMRSGIKHRYSGTEIVPEMIADAKKRYPHIEICEGDLLAREYNPSGIDICLLSGTLNLSGHSDKQVWQDYVFRLLEKMFQISRAGIAFNFLTAHSDWKDEELTYLDAGAVFDFCSRRLSRFVSIDAAYPLYEVTAAVFKESYVSSQFPGEAFSKYFRDRRDNAPR